MKTTVKYILIFLGIILATAIVNKCHAQETKIAAMAGYKAFEVSASYTAESELIFGVALSVVDSELAEKRANNNDKGKVHDFSGKAVPAAFGLIGAKFDDLSIIGKIGGAYLNQTINGKPEPQKAYLAFGLAVDYKITDTIGLRGSYDSVNSALVGLSFNF